MSDIIIDVTRLLWRLLKKRLPTGVDRVSQAYIHYFADRAKAVVRIGNYRMFLSQSGSLKLFDALSSPAVDRSQLMNQLLHNELFSGFFTKNLSGSFVINTGHNGLEHESYLLWMQRLQVKPLFFVHDLIPIRYPEYCRPGIMEKHRSRMNNVLRYASGVITNSQTTLDDLVRYAEKTGYRVPPSIAAPITAAELPAPSSNRPVAEPYFLILGTIEPRKNHLLLLQIWRNMIDRLGDRAPRLVIIGQRGWECENVVDLLERCEALKGFVMELPACSDTDLATYLHHAQALLFPSFAEGYGMPLMEALTAGVPVIASDLPVFREIAGNIPYYLDPLDSMGWIACIEAFSLSSNQEPAAQKVRRVNFMQPTWAGHFQLVEEWMNGLA
ncbi:MAG: glycosyltransferase family 4 protein [Chlorobiaceae bacterium]|nr:glycosyltransferase family 4 protein [Chlorobiaceae bacterium]